MKLKTTGIFLRQKPAFTAVKHSIALTLFFLALPCLLPAQTLLHRYSFVSDASDSIGTANGTIIAPGNASGSPVTIANGLSLPGGGGGGFSGYVSLPSGILTNTASITVECWLTQNTANTWATPWDFANNNNQNFGLIPSPGNNGNNLEVAFTPHGNEVDLQSSVSFPSGSEQYVSVTFNNSTLVGNLYTNGALVATHTFPDASYTPGSIGGAAGTAVNALGNDIYGDTQFQGTIYEFRIWNGVVSQRYLSASAVAGPGVVINNLTPTSASVSAGPNLTATATELATVLVQLPQTGSANLLATADATNWTSSNPSVLTVSSNGVITGVGPGTATVSATVAGVNTGNSNPITVAPLALLHRYSFVSDASDSVGTANGTVVAPTTGSPVTINNGLVLPGGGGPGFSGYVTLPGGILTNTTSLTVECWVTENSGNTWAQIWNFNNSQSQNFGLIPYPGNNGNNLEVGITPNGNEQDIASSVRFPTNSEQYVSVVFNSSTLVGALYTNGALIATHTYPDRTYIPGSIGGTGGTTNNVLGQDPFPDPQFQGTIYEMRIWNGAVSPVYLAVSAVAGPSVIVTNLIPQSLGVSVNTTMIGSGTQQATVSGNFLQASGVTLTGAVTNWTSSNTSILTVNSSGLITAINGGTATVSATVNGVTATSATITVATTPPTFAQKPSNLNVVFGDTAVFVAQALGGSLSYQWSNNIVGIIAGATNSTLTLTNVGQGNAGTYTIFVSNSQGATNASALLTVSQAILQHRYSFVSDATDSVGGANGTIVPPGTGSPATISNGLNLPGGGGGGFSGYVALPSGILTNTTSITVECWATQNTANNWATIWDFANNGNQNFELCPQPDPGRNGGKMLVAFTPNGGEVDLDTPTLFPSGSEQYVSVTYNNSNLVASLYTNGALDATVTLPNATYRPGSIGGPGGTTQNWLGNNTYGDPQFQGTVYEFRIWNGVVSPVYLAVSAAAGSSVLVTNLTPASINVSVNSSMIAGQTQQATAIGNFAQASGVTITSSITNWTSSNPAVLTVNSSGLITAENTGSATISATYSGVTGISASITVPASMPIITQQPPASETLLAGATLKVSVGNIGTPPFVYRWYFNSGVNPISTAATPTLTIPNVQPGNTGSYTCLVSNQFGTALSSALSLSVVAPSTYQQAILSLGPLGYWPLTETSGTVAYDEIGGDNGTYIGGYSLGQPGPANTFFGPSSTSAGFDGSSAYVDIPEGPFNITGAVTTVAWVNLIAIPGFGGIIGHGDTSYRMSVNGSSQPGAADGNAPGDTDATSPNSIFGDWHMVSYSYSGIPGNANNGLLYVDGVLVASNTVSATPTGNSLDVWIGGSPDYGTARLLPANIAHAAIFNRALSAAQVLGLYNGTFVPGPETISITRNGSNVILSWQSGTLLQAPTVLGPYTTNSAAVSPYTIPATSSNQFFKVLVTP